MNALAANQLIPAVLWAAPVVQTLSTLAIAYGCYALRRNLGAQNMHPGALVAFVVISLALHAGYFLAPMWWKSGRCLLGAATMLPVAVVVLGTLVVVASQTSVVHDMARWGVLLRVGAVAGTGLLVAAYVAPLAVMLAGWM